MLINVHSYYSLRYGTIPIDQVVDLLIREGYDTAVLTDINNSTGILEFIKYCQLKKFNGLAGIEFRAQDKLLYIGIAKNNKGFERLNEMLSICNLEDRPLPSRAPELEDVIIVYPFGAAPEKLLDNEYVGVKPSQLTRLYAWSKSSMEKLIIWAPVTFSDPSDFVLHCKLRAIDHNILLSRLKAEQAGGRDELLISSPQLIAAYSAYPQIIYNTHRLLEGCTFEFDFTTVKNKQHYTTSSYDDKVLLEKLALEGWQVRYGSGNLKARERVRQELEVIDRMGFSAYFLITSDLIRYTQHRGFYHVGRGSGANSIVAYCLSITDVCPLELDLYFERFLNPKRKSPPDFDIDYSWKDRDDVFDYLFTRYGKRHTAIIGAMSTFKDRSIIREIAKVYGLPKTEVDRLMDDPSYVGNNNEIVGKVLATYQSLPKDFPNLRSMHSGGIIISELPISTYCAVDLPPKGIATMQFDMYTAEDIGFEKLDILSQRGIGHIKEAVDIIRKNRGVNVDIHNVAIIKEDSQVNAQLKSGDSIGCFYIESPAMRGVLKKLRCDNYLTLVAASSIIRPGVGSSGMMDEYIKRYRNPESFTYLHPIMEQQLAETFGVMIFQEDVLKIGHHFGGLDMADADVLRRLMSGKNRGRHHLEEIKDKFFLNCRNSGHDESIAREVWRQMESFAGYSFSKAHSASYAVESYQSLYLKAYYPLEFMTAVINNEGGFYARWLYVTEARKAGGSIHLPCINHSDLKTVIAGKDVYLGFNMIKGLQVATITAVLIGRSRGHYHSMEDLIARTAIPLEQLLLLVNAGALSFTGLDKKTLLWSAHLLHSKRTHSSASSPAQSLLLLEPSRTVTLPAFAGAEDETFFDEMELMGFSVTLSPFHMLQTSYRGQVIAAELMSQVGKKVKMVGLYVTAKPTRTKHGQPMAFGTFLDLNGDYFDTVHFPDVYKRYPFYRSGIYLIMGVVTATFDFPSITVEKIAPLPIGPDPRFSQE
ncbi:DNA polymerase III subunit alpha [Chitinophaga sp. CC14]|uniref:DNA polymerase III subunit alpha n=1 Tax=Chitinophaga sp. CC14 TaxID=3029199 RepID=UPI003B75DB55